QLETAVAAPAQGIAQAQGATMMFELLCLLAESAARSA
ncbi:hypothetical protein ACV33G_32780, partial [Pseudomonas aeruginosa]